MGNGVLENVPPPGAVEHELDRSRERLGTLLDELSRRSHQLADVPGQLRRHAVPVALACGAVLALGAAGIGLAVRRRQSRRRVPVQFERLRGALARMIAHPERVAPKNQGVSQKVLSAALASAASLLAKQLVSGVIGKATGRGGSGSARSFGGRRPASGNGRSRAVITGRSV
jgi:hypothetical protein